MNRTRSDERDISDEQLRCGACERLLPLDALFQHIHEECPVKWIDLEGSTERTPE